MIRFRRRRTYEYRRGRRRQHRAWLAWAAVCFLLLSVVPWQSLARDGVHRWLPRQAQAIPDAAPRTGRYGIAAGGGLQSYSERDLDRRMGEMAQSGAAWVRFDIDWSEIQAGGPAAYDWAGYDKVVTAAAKHRLNVVGLLTYTPMWARQKQCQTSPKCPPATPATFAAFAKKAAVRYGAQGVKTWEIWNEPNVHYFWEPAANPAAYARLLKAAYPAIKRVQPEATVLTGGLASAGDETGDRSPLTFVQELYRAGAKGTFDAVAVHPYSYPALPSYTTGGWNRWQQIVPIHSEMAAQGDGTKKIWITEYGAPTSGPRRAFAANDVNGYMYGQDYMTQRAQADLLSDALANYQHYLPWTGPFLWYNFRDGSNTWKSPENFFGLKQADGTPKPAYWIFKRAATSQ